MKKLFLLLVPIILTCSSLPKHNTPIKLVLDGKEIGSLCEDDLKSFKDFQKILEAEKDNRMFVMIEKNVEEEGFDKYHVVWYSADNKVLKIVQAKTAFQMASLLKTQK